jgi:Ca-activated chloride channel family protein
MTFAHPIVLWALAALPLLWLYDRRWGRGFRASLRFSSLALTGATTPGLVSSRWDDVLGALRMGALAALILVAARPQRGQTQEEVIAPATDILLCLDASDSMRSLDFKPKNRLETAVDVMRAFIRARTHDRLGLVVFGRYGFTQCPLTLDHGALLGFLDHVKIGMVPGDRTAIGSGLTTAVGRLKKSDAKSRVIVLLTDGRNNAGDVDPVTAAKAAAAFGVKVYTVGMGSREGAVYPVRDPFFGTERLVRDPSQDLDEDTLRRVADATGGRYFRATDTEGLRKVYAEIDKLEKTDVQVRTFGEYQEAGFPFLVLAAVLFALESALALTAGRRFP